jgi:hypothetical protein
LICPSERNNLTSFWAATESTKIRVPFDLPDEFGQRYVLDFPMTTTAGTATVRSGWIVLAGTDVLRLTSCYLL